MESSTEFLEYEQDKIFNMGIENLEMLSNIKKFIDFLDQLEIETNDNIILQLKELEDVHNMSEDMFNVFKIICQNLFNQILK
jgi:hypothetical protein